MSNRHIALACLVLIVVAGCGRDDRAPRASGPPAPSGQEGRPAPPPPPPPPPPPAPVAAPPPSGAPDRADDEPEMTTPPEGHDVEPGMAPEPAAGMRLLEEAEAALDVPEAQPKPPTLLARAKEALAEGRVNRGVALLSGAAVAQDDDAAAEVLDTLRWSPALKRPMLATRWGIAVLTGAPTGAWQGRPPEQAVHPEGHHPPHAGEPAAAPQPGAGGPLEFWHHVVGLPLAQSLESRMAEGAFGQWLSAAHIAAHRPAVEPRQPHGPNGEFHEAPPERAGHVNGGSPLQGLAATMAPDLDAAKRWAADQHLDVLMTIAVTRALGSARGVPQTSLTVKIFDVDRAQELWSSRPLDSRRVEAALAGLRSDDNPAEAFVGSVLQFVDQNLRLQGMPALEPAVVARRAEALAARKAAHPLPALVELRYYAAKGLLDASALREHYIAILGRQDGVELAADNVDLRRQVVEGMIR